MKHLLLLLGLWLLPALAVAQEEPAQDNPVIAYDLAWNPGGSQVAVALDDGVVQIIDATTKQIMATLQGLQSEVFAVRWNDAGDRLATADAAGNLLIWDASSWQLILSVQDTEAPDIAYFSLDWKPDNSQIAVSDSRGAITIYDSVTGIMIRRFGSHNGFVQSIDWSPNGAYIVSGGDDAQLILWDASTGARLATTIDYKSVSAVNAVSWRSDNGVVAVADIEGNIGLWDPFDSKILKVIEADSSHLLDIAWLPDEQFLVTSGGNQAISIWRVSDFQRISSIPTTQTIYSLAVHTTNAQIAYYEGGHLLVESIVYATPPPVPRGQVLYMAETEDERSALFLYDFDSDTEQQITDGSFYIGSPQLSPQGDWIVFHSDIGGNRDLYLMRPDGSELHALTSSAGADLFPVWSPDGNWIVYDYGIEQGYAEIYVIHRGGGDPVRVTTTGGARPDWSPDGERIAFIWRDAEDVFQIYTVRIDGSDRVQLTFGDEAANYPKWSPDSNWIAFNGDIGHNYYIQADGIGGPQRIPNLYTDSKLEWVNEDTLAYTEPGYASIFTIKIDGTDITELEMPFLWQANDLSLSGLKISP